MAGLDHGGKSKTMDKEECVCVCVCVCVLGECGGGGPNQGLNWFYFESVSHIFTVESAPQ